MADNLQAVAFKEFKKSNLTQFFVQNRAMLGYSYPSKSLVIAVHELVTNSLDNCIVAGIKPDIFVKIDYDPKYINTPQQKNRLILTVRDNGTGIPKKIIPTIFSTFLQGTKFRVNRQHMGQQGIGASGVVLFSLVETGEPTFMKTGDGQTTIEAEIKMDLETGESQNQILKEYKSDFRGTEIVVHLGEVLYGSGSASVDEYLKELFLANPFSHITFINPDGEKTEYKPIVDQMPNPPVVEKYHPLGLDVQTFLTLLNKSKYKTVGEFIEKDLQRSGRDKVLDLNKILKRDLYKINKTAVNRKMAEDIISAIKTLKWKAPKTDCLMPIGEEALTRAIDELFKPEFKTIITRPPKAYRGGIPFIVEIGLAWGENCGIKSDKTIEPQILRFANRVPLLFDASADMITQSIKEIDFSRYIKNTTNFPISVIVNINSTFIPFNNAGKMAIDTDEDIKAEFKNAMFDGLRKISVFINKKRAREILEQHKSKMREYEDHLARILSEASDGYKSPNEIKIGLEKIINKLGDNGVED